MTDTMPKGHTIEELGTLEVKAERWYQEKEHYRHLAIIELPGKLRAAEQERDQLMKEPNNRLDGYRELTARIMQLEDERDAAYLKVGIDVEALKKVEELKRDLAYWKYRALNGPSEIRGYPLEDLNKDAIIKLTQAAWETAKHLKDAIRGHRDQKGDDRCYLDDAKLYDALGEGQPDTTLPPQEVFLANCARYHAARQKPVSDYKTDNQGWVSGEENQKQLRKIQVLTECLERLKARAMPCGYDSGDSGVVQIIEDMEKSL